jgi:hypothetical protein
MLLANISYSLFANEMKQDGFGIMALECHCEVCAIAMRMEAGWLQTKAGA